MKNKNARPYAVKHSAVFMLLIATVFVSAIIAAPIYSVRSKSASRKASGSPAPVRVARERTTKKEVATNLPIPTSSPEIIQTYAADCTSPRSTFVLGETVCASVSFVTESDRFVNWLSPPSSSVAFSSPTIPDNATHFYSYTPTVVGGWKATIADPSDSSIVPVDFTVIPAGSTLATYAADCTTSQSSFNLGQTICIKVSGLTNAEFPQRRVEVAEPDGFVLASFDVTDNSNQFSYAIPAATTELFAGQTIDHRGTWVVALVDTDADLRLTAPVTVHKSNLLVDRVADLQLTKFLLPDPGDPPTAGSNVTFQLEIINKGPDAATNPHLADFTLPNTTFVSFDRVAVIGSNLLNGAFSSDSSMLNSDYVRLLRDPADARNRIPSSALLPTMSDSSLTFTCVKPSVGAAGSTTCTASGELAAGETAIFTAVYKVSTNTPNGAQLSDDNSASVGSDTTDQFSGSNAQSASITTSNPTPPACVISCPDNMTVGTNATDGQGHPGAIVTFGPEASGSCGAGITSSPSSGSFFQVGTTPVTSTTGSGASCSFNVTVVNTPQPTISCAADQSAVAPSGQSEVSVTVTQPTFNGSFVTGQVPPPLTSSRSDQRDVTDPYPIGTTIITWTVTDQYGTAKSCSQRVVVTSADAPTISCPSDKSFAAPAGSCETTLTAAQIGTPTVGGLNTTLDSSRSDHLALTDPFPAGQTAITWTATNAIGSASCTQIITITTTGDTTPPVLTIPPDINISTSECSVLLDDELGVATATDNCTAAVNITRTGLPQIPCPIPGNPSRTCDSFFFPTGTTNITYVATDASGNTATGVQHINIAEDPVIFPTITAPSNVSVSTLPTDTGCGTFVGDATLGTATASDNCPGVTVVRTGVPAGNVFPVGDTFITYTATDRTGHSSTATQKVTVADATLPIVTAPGAVTLYTGPNATSCSVTVANLDAALGTGSATDNCPGVGPVTRSGVPAGNTFAVGVIYTITYSATDAHGNTGSATQQVTVVDNTAPTITTNGQTPSMWPPNHDYHTFGVTDFVASVFDNCGGVSVNDVVIQKVTSDETEDGDADGSTTNDIVIAANCKSVQLRAERSGTGDGRVYTITFRLTDTHGNTTTTTAKVVVAHNVGETPVDSGPHYTVNGSCQ